jgi:hypothetical protein
VVKEAYEERATYAWPAGGATQPADRPGPAAGARPGPGQELISGPAQGGRPGRRRAAVVGRVLDDGDHPRGQEPGRPDRLPGPGHPRPPRPWSARWSPRPAARNGWRRSRTRARSRCRCRPAPPPCPHAYPQPSPSRRDWIVRRAGAPPDWSTLRRRGTCSAGGRSQVDPEHRRGGRHARPVAALGQVVPHRQRRRGV